MSQIETNAAGETVETLLQQRAIRVERIVSHGHACEADFWYDQVQDEWVMVLSGEAKLRFEDEPSSRHLKAGDHVHITAHRRHRVEWTTPDEPTVWLAVHYEQQRPAIDSPAREQP